MISIIIPTRNEERFLQHTISTLRNMKNFEYEIIVSDGKSSDATISVARQYADIVVEYTKKEKQTIAGGRNAGAAVASGDFFVFIDADVLIPDVDIFFHKARIILWQCF